MSIDRIIGIMSLVVGIVGVVVGIIGCFCLSKANKLKAKDIHNSTINQADTMIVNNGADTYAIIKIAKGVTQEELKSITETLSATTLDLEKLKKIIDDIPKIHSGVGPPPTDLKDGDVYLQYM
jgi:hypothetical protein